MAANTKLDSVRFASFNASLNRNNAGELINDLSTPDNEQAKAVAEIIQRTNPDILLLNEFDYDENGEAIANFQKNYLEVSQNCLDGVDYPYIYLAPSNTGIASGFDFDNNGSVGGGNDAFGFGNFPGQFGMVLLSKYPIVENEVRTFQDFLWKDMPGALLPDDANTAEPNDWYSSEELEVFRLSSKSHWDIPININGEIIHVLASHPTPPVFDGEEDRNGRRNHDEIRFWSDYITPGNGDYIYDDEGGTGGLSSGEKFVIMGDQNADPNDGDSTDNAILQLLDNPQINTAVTPLSEGGIDAANHQAGVNIEHTGNSAFDTADFNDNNSGNLRVDYVLPSNNLDIQEAGVFWSDKDDPLFDLLESSDHRLVYADVEKVNVDRKTIKGVNFLGEVNFPTGLEFEGTEVGGISGLTYDANRNIYYGLSDDRSQINPARFYDISIDLSDGSLDDGDIRFDKVTTLLNKDSNSFPESSLDPEGIALTKNNTIFISSEGDTNQLINPFVNEFSLQGQQIAELPVPEKFNPTADESRGIRNNAAFESLTITPNQRYLYTAVEDALFQDGTRADLEQEAKVRIVKYDLQTREVVAEFVYELDKVAEVPNPADGFKVNGLVELLAIDNNGTLLALERSFSEGKGNTVKLYEIQTQGALDVKGEDSLFYQSENTTFEIDPAVNKRLLVDFADLGITPDNLEALTLGSILPDGSQSLIVASDNNFNDTQTTQFLGLGLDFNTIPAVIPKVETPDTIDGELTEVTLNGDSDDPAIWVNPNNKSESIVIGTLKNGGLATFNLKGEIQQVISTSEVGEKTIFQQLQEISQSQKLSQQRYNNVDIIYDFPLASMLIGEESKVDLAVFSDRANDSLAIFSISENGQLNKLSTPQLDDIKFSIFGVDDNQATAYGLATYTSPISGKNYVFVTQADGNKIAQIELTSRLGPADEQLITAEIVRTLELPTPTGDVKDSQSEGIVVDRELGFVYVAMEEEIGILKFSAEPDKGNEFTIVETLQEQPDLQQIPFTDFITFGDSTADVGNIFLSTEQTIPPSPPYFNGRFSNGPLVPELLAEEIGLSASTPFLAGGTNYAFGGAELGSGEDEGEPSVGEQINFYLGTDTPTSSDLFFISAGGNSLIPDLEATPTEILANIPDIEDTVEKLTSHITILANQGAENFLISNVPPLGNIPIINSKGIRNEVNNAVTEYNDLLDTELDDLENQLGVNIYELDIAAEFANFLENPSDFGFTDITNPALEAISANPQTDISQFIWWDDTHPTATAYSLLADALIDDIPKGTNQFTTINNSPLVPDIEGLSIYYGDNGTGYLIASSQGDSSYSVFNREGDNEYLGSFVVGDNNGIDQVNETDGLDVINVGLGSEFPNGLLVLQDGANDPQNVIENDEELENNSTNFKFIAWDELANIFESPLQIDNQSYNPRNPRTDLLGNGISNGNTNPSFLGTNDLFNENQLSETGLSSFQNELIPT